MEKVRQTLGIELARRTFRLIKVNGGIMPSLNKMWRAGTLKFGTYMGTDRFGNKYFENNYYFLGRNRWVEYSRSVGLDYDASQVDADWHGWLHNRTNETPITKPSDHPSWKMQHSENMSGSTQAYYPYSTVNQKVHQWTPPSASSGQQTR